MTVLSLPLAGLLASQVSAQWFQQRQNNRLIGSSFGVPNVEASYDYLVVGGGLAGSVTAARLIEGTNATVAVIEGGSFYEMNNGNWSQIPYYSTQWADLDWQPNIDWGMVAEPDSGANNRRLHYAQGKALGGSSGRNQMLYNRGTKGSFGLWAEEVGDDAYTWDNLLPFHEKSLTFTPPNMDVRAANASANYSQSTLEASRDGPLHLSYSAYAQPLSSYGPAASAAAGVPPVEDFISGKLDGYNYFASTIDPATGLRSSAETAFLSPAMYSDRLTVYQWNTVSKILFDDEKRATGVEVSLQGLPPYKLSAKKEVILSAGAMRSPHLLMLSGVGPKATLQANNIPVVNALEGVGQSMHDSCAIGGVSFQMSAPTSDFFTESAQDIAEANAMLLTNGTGPLTNMGADFFAWEKLPEAYRLNFSEDTREAYSQWPDDWPEIEMSLSPSGSSPFSDESAGGENDAVYGQLNVILVAAISRGNVSINSSHVTHQPTISTNWLSDPADQEVAIAAYRRARDIVLHIGARVGNDIYPNATVFDDDVKLLDFIKSEGVNPIHHASSTNRMGRDGDEMAVVDSQGRVFGVQGLRVVDSSAFRHTPPGHTQATTYMLAEKLVADIIAASDVNES